MRYTLLIFIFVLITKSLISQTNFWQESVGPYGGTIRELIADVQGNLYATSDYRFFKSTDGGWNWHTYKLDSMSVEGLGALSIDSSGRILIGHQYGVIISTDQGETWKEIGQMPITKSVTAFAIDSSGTLFGGTWRNGIFRSSDHGVTWTRCSSESLTTFSFYINQQTNIILAGSENGIYRSSNSGATWEYINPGGASFTAFLKHSSGTLYSVSRTSQAGIYSTTDDGLTWTELNTPLRYCESVISTKSGRIIVGSSWGMYSSDDLGITWNKKGLVNELALTLSYDSNERLYAGTFGGVYLSTDDGEKWQDINTGIVAAHIRFIAADDQGYVYAAWYRNINKSSDFGATFEKAFTSSSDNITTITIDSKGYVYAIMMDTIFISTDHGSNWQVACATGIWQPPWALTVDPYDNLFTITRSGAVYRSTDQGNHWTNVYSGGGFATFVNIGFSTDGIGFFTRDSSIYRSTDGGLNWNRIAQNIHTNGTQSFCINTQGIIFLGTNGSGILRSTDQGESWSESNNGLPSSDTWVRFIVTTGDELLVNMSSYYYPPGLTTYRSTNNGESWFRESSGLPNDFVTALSATSSGYLYAGTQSNGIYHSHATHNAVKTENVLKGFSLYQSIPNPFNSSVSIMYFIPRAVDVTLKIYDVLGKEIAILVNERKQAGEYKVTWDAEGVPSGVYFYRIVAGEFIEAKKMVVMK